MRIQPRRSYSGLPQRNASFAKRVFSGLPPALSRELGGYSQWLKHPSAQEYLENRQASAVATVDFDLRPYQTKNHFKSFKFFIHSLIPANDGVDLYYRFSTDGGATFIAAGYNFSITAESEGSGADFGSGSTTQIQANDNGQPIGSGATEGVVGEATLFLPSSATAWCKMTWLIGLVDSAGTPAGWYHSGSGMVESAADVDAFRFMFSAGNVGSCNITLAGIR